jgi:cytochrome c oxidase subunit 2
MTIPRLARRLPLAVVVVAVAAFAGCGGDDDGAVGAPATPTAGGAELSPEAAAGLEVAKDSGCAGCHGGDFSGSIGPGWVGLAGSTVTLEGGQTVVADDAYLTRAIQDPAAELVAGFAIAMPENDLSAEQVDQIVAYINELGP